MGKQWKQWQTLILGGLQTHCRWWQQPWNSKMPAPWKKSYDKPRQHIKKQRHTFPTKVHIVKAVVFLVVIYRCKSWTIKKGWALKSWFFQTMVLEKTLESPLDCKEIKLLNSKGNQPWIFIGRTDAEAEAPLLWPPDVKSQLTGKDPDAGKDWRQEKGTTENGMAGWHHQWMWVWVSSGRWWRTGKPGVVQFMGSQRVRHNWATEQQQYIPQVRI